VDWALAQSAQWLLMLRYEEHRQCPGVSLALLQTASLVETRYVCTISAIERVIWNYLVLHAMRSACYLTVGHRACPVRHNCFAAAARGH